MFLSKAHLLHFASLPLDNRLIILGTIRQFPPLRNPSLSH